MALSMQHIKPTRLTPFIKGIRRNYLCNYASLTRRFPTKADALITGDSDLRDRYAIQTPSDFARKL
jgi:hypothetical protein